jgi:hypothetical protein
VQRDAIIKLYQPGPVFARFRDYYNVFIDDLSVGEVWPKQVKSFQVAAGEHRVRLKHLFVIRSRTLVVTIDHGQAVELACWPNWTGFGPIGLHAATKEESERMKKLLPEALPPRNLGEQPST